jgi:release factor glutamine methyltransferase
MIYERFVREATEVLEHEASLDRAEAHVRARLLLDGLTQTRYAHLLSPDSILDGAQLKILESWLQDAARGRPIPYILNRAPFFGLEFEVDERVLIPRPETELLIETALQKLRAKSAPHLADLGTGSGAIAVSLAKTRPDAQIWASDISPGALEIARRNADSNGVSIKFLDGAAAWLEPLQGLVLFDAIVSNPPYIAAQEIETLDIGVREFEPRLALDGGADGLNPYREIAAGAAKFLQNDGFVALEIGAGQWDAIEAMFVECGWEVEAPRRDLAGIERVLVASHPS